MNNKSYKYQYDSDVYKKKLGDLLKITNYDKQVNGYLDNLPSQTPTIPKSNLKKRQQTPYPRTEAKISTARFTAKGRVSFGDSFTYENGESDTSTTSLNSPNKPSKVPKKKCITFSGLPKSKKRKLIERKVVTPFPHSSPIKYEANNEEPEYASEHSFDDFTPSLSESPERHGLRESLKKQNHTKKINKDTANRIKKKKMKDINSHPKKNSDIEINPDLAYNNEENEFINGLEKNDSEKEEDYDLELTSSFSCSQIEPNDFEKDADVSEDLNLEYSDDEICEYGNVEYNELNENEEVVGTAEYFPLNNMLVIALHKNSKLYLHGLTSIEVLHGAIEVLGYTLTNSSGSVEIFSPRGSSFLYFETKENTLTSFVQDDLFNTLSTLGMESDVANELYLDLQPSSAVILCKNINKSEMKFLEKHTSQQVFPKDETPLRQCVFKNKINDWSVFQPNIEWDSLVSSMDITSKLFICGGKSVGKSTMLRYIINKLLLEHAEILVIDLDPGQPEFTISGCISATIVKEPIFGPNYTHLRKSARCLFIPNINISYQPEDYLTTVKEFLLSCLDLPLMPTIINYMGYTRGLGLEILSAVVAYAQPTCLVEIQSRSRQRNFKKKLTYDLICDKSKLLASAIDFIPEFPICTIQSMADANEGWHLEPRQIREMSVLSYLGKNIPEGVLSVTDSRVPAYVVNLSEIQIICNGEIVDPCVVNANLVALCSGTVSVSSYTCHGWGVVRGINLITKELFLITPLLPVELEQVTCIILGSVSLPPSLYMTADNNIGPVPFVSQGVFTALGQIPKRSHLPPRNKQD